MLTAALVALGFTSQTKAQNMNELDAKQQKIVSIAAATAVGDLERLKTELGAGLDAELTINQIKEVLVHLYAYCGFPRSLQGINTFMAVMDERQAHGIRDTDGRAASPITDTGDKYARGKATLEKLTAVHETAPAGANAFAPAIDLFLKEHLFADIFDRDVLTYQERELTTVSALAAMTGVEPMLQSHINMAMNTGLTEGQIRQAISIIGWAVGAEQANKALDILVRVVQNRQNQ